jgi:hypothetical protein
MHITAQALPESLAILKTARAMLRLVVLGENHGKEKVYGSIP